MKRIAVDLPERELDVRSGSYVIKEAADASDDRSLPKLLSAAMVAEIFNRSERTIRNWIRAGHLRPVRVGRSVFFRETDIAALLDDGGAVKKLSSSDA